MDRSVDWFRQAQRDLRHARHSLEDQDFEWGCFAAQQAAEKAVKALHQRLGLEGWGHSVRQLLASLPSQEAVPTALHEAGLLLDRFFLYPDPLSQRLRARGPG